MNSSSQKTLNMKIKIVACERTLESCDWYMGIYDLSSVLNNT